MSDSKKHVLRALNTNTRYDGRKNDEYRAITIEYNVSQTAEGSAMVTIGNTQIIAGVKLSVEAPFPDTPDEGVLMVDAQLLPLASAEFESGPPGIDSIELARVTDRGLRESKCMDLNSLVIKKGEKVWNVVVDICTVNADGNLFDASALAAVAALKQAVFPELTSEKNPDYKKKTTKTLSLQKVPIAVTVWKVGQILVVDPSRVEEQAFESRLTITTLEDGTICALQKGGSGTITHEDVQKMIELALAKAQELRNLL